MNARRSFLGLAAAAAAATALRPAAAAAHAAADVLDTPAQPSRLAAAALVNGLALAGRRVVAVGQRGHVLLSDDAGVSWRQADVPLSSDLTAVHFPTPEQGWAVGHDGAVLHSRDGGARWQRALDGRGLGTLVAAWYEREAPRLFAAEPQRAEAWIGEARRIAAQGADVPLLDVFFEDAQRGWIVGAFGMLLHSADGGTNWQPWLHAADNPKALHLYAVRAVAGQLYLAGEQGLLRRLDRETQAFRTIALPYEGSLFGLLGDERALLVHGLRGTALRSVDGGASWHRLATGVTAGLSAGTRDARGRFVLASQAGHLLRSEDAGATFSAVAQERPLPAAALAALDGALVIGGPRGLRALALH